MSVQTPALRSIGNIVTGDDIQTQVVLNSNVLPALLTLLASPKEEIRKKTCWTISNITAGNVTQIQSVIEANLFPPLIEILTRGVCDTKVEACWAIANVITGQRAVIDNIRYIVSQGAIKPLCDALFFLDVNLLGSTLKGLENILRVGEFDKPMTNNVNQMALYIEEAGGMERIYKLQSHENEGIYLKCYSIMEKYFSV